MKYDFDEVIDRHNTGSSKWDNVGPRVENPDAHLYVGCRCDFRCPQSVVDAVIKGCNILFYDLSLCNT